MSDVVERFSIRTFRLVGLAVVLIGVPSVVVTWGSQGALFGSVVAFGHLYLGLFIAFGVPWLKVRRSKTF